MKIILKGVLFWITVTLASIYVSAIDGLAESDYFAVITALVLLLCVWCYKIITPEEFLKATFKITEL